MKDFPSFTKEDRLSTFIGLKTKKGVPKPLRDYCQAALDSKRSLNPSNKPVYSIHKEDSSTTVYFLEGDHKTVSGKMMDEKIPNFQGVNLILATFEKVNSTTDFRMVVQMVNGKRHDIRIH